MIPQNVAAKNAANPAAVPISRLANHPKSPSGTPNRYPSPNVREVVDTPLCVPSAIPVEYCFMAEGVQNGLLLAIQVAREAAVRKAPNGINYASFGETGLDDHELQRMVQAVPTAI